MATRRQSSSFTPKATPYKIYHTVSDAGKNLGGTKKKLCWRFGWTDSEYEHEIDLKHSLVTGKRTIYEDGREIISTQGIFSTEFSHGWESNKHIFRIEAITGLGDHSYIFTIDGVKFEDFQDKPSNLPKSDAMRPTENSRGDFNSPNPQSQTSANSTTTKSTPKLNKVFSSNDNDNSFDPFTSDSNKQNTTTSVAFDPFVPSSDPFYAPKKDNDLFTSGSSKSGDLFKATAAAPNTGSTLDFFSDPPTSQQHTVPVTQKSQNDLFPSHLNHHTKSSNIADDFSGMTFESPSPAMLAQTQSKPSIVFPDSISQVSPPPPAPTNVKDNMFGLVDLDLSNAKNQPQRRSSIQQGPTLNQMNTVNTNNASANQNPFGVTHMTGVQTFNNPTPVQPTPPQQAFNVASNDPFAPSNTFPLQSSSATFNPTPVHQSYTPLGGVPVTPIYATNNSNAISSMANPFGGPPSGPGYGNPYSTVPLGPNTFNKQGDSHPNASKSNSLDSLNWKM